MAIEVKILARTQELGHNYQGKSDKYLMTYGGKMAGVCYMPENYFDEKIQNVGKAIERAKNCLASGHHSVFDHAYISIQISGLPKILAMLLNSTGFYTTSEKSARYTVMKPETDVEKAVYDKWKTIFERQINEVYPDIDPKTTKKLAQENARYLISVFTPTHMVYTTSYRQFGYLCHWLNNFVDECDEIGGKFYTRLGDAALELVTQLNTVSSASKVIKDNKCRGFEMFVDPDASKGYVHKEYYGDVYTTSYLASFASLAQLQRHRTLNYKCIFNGDPTVYGVYIPEIIKGTDLEAEWKSDFNLVKDCIPQGTLIKVIESGRTVDFFLKCKERLCGRAQLETMLICKSLMETMLKNTNYMANDTYNELKKCITSTGKIATKCRIKGIRCKEMCMWGFAEAFNRKI